jgi:hypothetical protein
MQWVPWEYPGVKWPVIAADHSPPAIAKNIYIYEYIHISTPTYVCSFLRATGESCCLRSRYLSVGTPNVNNLTLNNIMLRTVIAVQQFMTEFEGAVSEEEKLVKV